MKASLLVVLIFFLFQKEFVYSDYKYTEDSFTKGGVPKGKVIKREFATSKIYPGTVRDYWIYVPNQYVHEKPTPFMIFQDGGWYQNDKGHTRATVVFDNLIHKKEIPEMIGIFVNPGIIPSSKKGGQPRKNRSLEYDTLNAQYAKFLLEDILPEVEKDYNLTKDPEGRSLCGISSGGFVHGLWPGKDQINLEKLFHTLVVLQISEEGMRIRLLLEKLRKNQ